MTDHHAALIGLYNQSTDLMDKLTMYLNKVYAAGLKETAVSLGVEDALKALYRVEAGLHRRIEIAAEEVDSGK